MKEQFNPSRQNEIISGLHLKNEESAICQRDRFDMFISTLLTSVRKTSFFAADADDEFTIVRENSHQQGIFKVWAPHVIPFLDNEVSGGTEIIEAWSRDLEKKPLSLHESLEQWRAFSAIFDRRLQRVFSNREVPQDAEDAVAELFCRMKMAFALAAPFYNLEALVADSRENRFGNPINTTEITRSGGKLDVIALMLPSALADHVLAERFNWNGLTWEEIQKRVSLMKDDFLRGKDTSLTQQFVLITRIANIAGIDTDEVIFAANALQFIPLSVGGKKEDLSQDNAIKNLTKLLKEPIAGITTNLVARDINALIRFLNWSPAIKSSENFQGKFWMYDAVCATASKLLGIIKNNPCLVFDEQFADVFANQLAPQLDGLDASSAKGRFLLQLLTEGKFKDCISEKIKKQTKSFVEETMFALNEIKKQEALVDISQCLPTFLVGGKADGLRKAMQIFEQKAVLGGKVVTSETIGEWLQKIEGIEPLIRSLNLPTTTIETKIRIGENIAKRIGVASAPIELIERIRELFSDGRKIVLRSSSFDEDAPLIGPAPGIYESVIDIDSNNDEAISSGLKTVIASFFSEKAISFRELKGLRHKPIFAVLVQEFIDNVGGSVFINNGSLQLTLARQPSMVNSRSGSFEELSIPSGEGESMHGCRFLTKEQLQEIIWLARKAEKIFGPSDIEFVVNPESNKVQILQLRLLQQLAKPNDIEKNSREQSPTIEIDDPNRLPKIGDVSINLQINNKIDLEKFQGSLFRWLTVNEQKITSITLESRIPTTCHFANIVGCLGIDLRFIGEL